MNPSFFGPPGAELLGIHHPPRAGARAHGVVLCPPAPQETARSHWAFRKLADGLAKAGFDVLRFDYRGTGDSAGELADSSPTLWAEDIRAAVRELKDVSGVRKVSAVGFRLGALVLAQAASQGVALEQLVLWEPVISARAWMEELSLIERQLRRELYRAPSPEAGELLGFALPPALWQQWQALDLLAVPPWPTRTALVAAATSPLLEQLRATLVGRGQDPGFHLVPAAGGASQRGALLGNEAMERIITVLGERR